jgi:hypothetical protein
MLLSSNLTVSSVFCLLFAPIFRASSYSRRLASIRGLLLAEATFELHLCGEGFGWPECYGRTIAPSYLSAVAQTGMSDEDEFVHRAARPA